MDYTGRIINKNPPQPTQASASGVWTLDEQAAAVKNNSWPIVGVPNPISKSLRFNSADSAYLSRTPGAAGNQKTWTWSGWVKVSKLSINQYGMFSSRSGPDWTRLTFGLDNTNTWIIFGANAANSTQISVTTTQVFRDPSSWYHFVIAIDTTQSTSTNRFKLYINGSQVTAFAGGATYPNQNDDLAINALIEHNIGKYALTGNFVDGYMTEINFIDGQALTPSDFGMTDTATGVWIPKKYTGTYGGNGFYVNFKDSASTTTIGYDYSGNGNNWTANNFSVTAGAGNDSLTDVPTPWVGYSATNVETGGIIRGNYCTLSPIYALNVTYNTPTNGNLEVALSNNSTSYGTFSFTTGKWYWEITVSAAVTSGYVGVMDSTFIKTDNSWSSQARTYIDSGNKYGGSSSSYGASWTNGDVIGVAVDMDAGTIVFYKNGSSQGTAFSDLAGKEWKPMVYATTTTYTLNFGQRPFAYTPPSGYKSLVTTNLPTPTIGATSTTQANDYFNAVLYTGTGSSLGVTGVGFQPDFVWIKSRSAANDHALYDVNRGVQKQIESNTNDAQTTETTGLTAFNTDGFTVGALAQLNTNTATYVGWNWKGGGTGVTNTAGSVTSTVSANTTAGFSVVTCSPSGSAFTVGHGLGVAPKMIIEKLYETANAPLVYHASLGTDKYLTLSSTVGEQTSATLWQNTAPTSTVLSFTATSDKVVFYCFAEVAGYSAFGKYTGNGSTDGPFIYTGFRPAYLLIKQSSASGEGWRIFDDVRSPYNQVNKHLIANSNVAESTETGLDFVSNGFKLRNGDAHQNGNGATYIYAAFAEFPFKFSNAR